MNAARREILERIRNAQPRGGPDIPVPRRYRRSREEDSGALLSLLQERLEDYGCEVNRSTPSKLARAIFRRLEARGIGSLVAPADLPEPWLGEVVKGGIRVSRDGAPDLLSHSQVASGDGILTGCSLAIAETGTLILDGGVHQGRRVLSLLPDLHICIVFRAQVVGSVPEAVDAVSERARGGQAPLTWISGPSATSDIELIRVEGVHGPRTLDVILVEDAG